MEFLSGVIPVSSAQERHRKFSFSETGANQKKDEATASYKRNNSSPKRKNSSPKRKNSSQLLNYQFCRFDYSKPLHRIPILSSLSLLQIDLLSTNMFLKLALLTASSFARANPSDSSDAAVKITASMVNLSSDNRARRTDAPRLIRAASKETGTECSFTTSLKAGVVQADVGVLTCAEHESCIEDGTSSLGGRCVLSDEEYEYASEFFVTDTHRRLGIACTMSDGTAGMKCNNRYACDKASTDIIACGSCNGYKACYEASGVISEGSCNGMYACYGLGSAYNIGANSCNEYSACKNISCDVSDNKCNTSEECLVGYCPTASPSNSPTASPSASPSSSPSASPTAPTTSPTASPSASPSTSKASKSAKGGKGTKSNVV